jgi:hypothetical protein
MLWAPKGVRIPTLGISGPPLGSPGTKWHLDVAPMERWWLPPSSSRDESCESEVVYGLR